jgi:hypothetical protein
MTNVDADAFLARFADEVRVPQANRDHFFFDLRCNFRDMRELARGLPYAAEIRSVGKIADEISRAILNLNDEARSAIERGLWILGQGYGSHNKPDLSGSTATPKLLEFLNFVHGMRLACGAVTSLPCEAAPKFHDRFRPQSPSLTDHELWEIAKWWQEPTDVRRRPTSYRHLFDLFLRVMARDIFGAGGRFTIQKNSGKGTIIPALTLLRDEAPPGLLPVGLIPAKLSPSTLQRRKTDWSKAVHRPNLHASKPRVQT